MKVRGCAGQLFRTCLALVLVTLATLSSAWAQSVRLYWDPNPETDQVLGYVLVYGPAPGSYTQSLWLPASALTHEVTGLAPGTYYFAIRAYNADGDSGYSNEVRVDVAEAVTSIPPSLTGLAPSAGPLTGGTDVTVTGANFQTGATVFVGGKPATVLSLSATQLTFRTPAATTPGAVTVRIVNPDGLSVELVSGFTYRMPAPTITSIGPAFGPVTGGTEVAVTGANYMAGLTVTVGGKAATLTSLTATRVTFRTPATTSPGIVAVRLTNPDGQGVELASAFSYRALAPTVTGVSPATGSAAGGEIVTISGSNFLSGLWVSVDSTPAEVISVTPSAVVVRTPAHAPARVGLTVTNPDGQFVWAGAVYTYVEDGPAITHVLPARGPVAGGTQVTILGAGFGLGVTVRIGGLPAKVLSVDGSSIVVEAPAHDPGPTDVMVITPSAKSTMKAQSFTYEAADEPFRRYFAEGASGFFQTRFAVTNPHDEDVPVTVTFGDTAGTATTMSVNVPAQTRITIDESNRPAIASDAFATTFEAPKVLGVERTMTWASGGLAYGSHAETGVEAPRTSWVLAEGATINNFNTFYLLLNPTDTYAMVKVQYLLSTGQRIEKIYGVAPRARTNVWVNKDDPLLEAAEMSATITSLNGVPIVVERSMYRNNGDELFTAGHSSAAVHEPALRWFLAEGATLGAFDEFVLIANPNASPATLRVSYLRANMKPLVKYYTAAPNSRLTLWVDQEDPELASAEVSIVVESLTPTPIVVERAMWWRSTDNGDWEEGHDSRGATETAARWLAVDCEAGGPGDANTWVLVANTGPTQELVRFRLLTETGETRDLWATVDGNSRFTLDTLNAFPEVKGRRYSVLVEATRPQASLVVERSTYSSTPGKVWAAGTNSLGIALP